MAAQLRQSGHTADIFDRFAIQARAGRAQAAIDDAMLARVTAFQPDLIGLSTISPLISDTVHCATLIREAGFRGGLWAGGYHATALPELTLRRIPELDGVVAGEGEEVWAQVADGADPAGLPGVWRRDGPVFHPPRIARAQVAQLDRLPLPALDLMDMGFYTARSHHTVRRRSLRAATLITSRGCEFRCRFCAESLTYGSGIRFHSPEYVLAWIQKLISDYAVTGLHFHDNDFLADEERARAVCDALQMRGLHRKVRWSIQARADRLTPVLIRLLRQSGCVLVEIGIEAATQPELDRLRKGIKADQAELAVRECRRAGLDVHAYMLQGTEEETIDDLDRRLEWLQRVNPDSFQWSEVSLFPGTLLYAEKGKGFFERNPWTQASIQQYYSTDHLSGIPAEERRRWMKENFLPFAQRHWWRHAVGRLPLRALAAMAWATLLQKWKCFRASARE